MGTFNRTIKLSSEPLEERTILELIETVKHVNPMNVDSIRESLKEDPNAMVWLNPNNQTCFNAGWYSKEDFLDWAIGTGRIVKGKTQKDKDKFMEYARAYDSFNPYLFIYEEYLDILDPRVQLNPAHFLFSPHKNQQLKTKGRKSREIISDVLSNQIRYIREDIEDMVRYKSYNIDKDSDEYLKIIEEETQDIKNKYHNSLYHVCHTLSIMGHGYFGACNTPCDIENLAWARDLPFVIAYKEFLEKSGFKMPDFKFVRENRYTY